MITVKKDSIFEFTEKKSVFIGQVFYAKTVDEAMEKVQSVRNAHPDATHVCWAYSVCDGTQRRASDDGEPQGTAGQPMLGVFQKEGVTNVCCVVTRYFGGILLGAGGLVRAYTQSAKDALDAAGISVVRRWVDMAVDCPYNFFERVKNEVAALDGVVGNVEYAAGVTVHALMPEERTEEFAARMVELSAGTFEAIELGEMFKGVPVR